MRRSCLSKDLGKTLRWKELGLRSRKEGSVSRSCKWWSLWHRSRQILQGLVGPGKGSGIHPTCNGRTLEGLKQESARIWLAFLKDHPGIKSPVRRLVFIKSRQKRMRITRTGWCQRKSRRMGLWGLEQVESAGFADGKWRKIPRKDLQVSDWSSGVGGNAKCIDGDIQGKASLEEKTSGTSSVLWSEGCYKTTKWKCSRGSWMLVVGLRRQGWAGVWSGVLRSPGHFGVTGRRQQPKAHHTQPDTTVDIWGHIWFQFSTQLGVCVCVLVNQDFIVLFFFAFYFWLFIQFAIYTQDLCLCNTFSFVFLNFLFFSFYNVVLVSAVQQCKSAIIIHISPPSRTFLPSHIPPL